MIKQFGNVGGLYAGFVGSPGLVPIPFSRSARENLGIFELPNALNFDPSPAKRRDARRSSFAIDSRQ